MASAVSLELRNSFSLQDQRLILKLFYAQGKSATEARQELKKVVGDNALGKTQVHAWYKRFQDCNFDVSEQRGGDQKSGDEKEKRIEDIKSAFEETKAWSISSLLAKVGFSRSACYSIVTKELGIQRVNPK